MADPAVIKVDDEKVSGADENVDLADSEHDADEPLNPGSKHSSQDGLDKDGKKKKKRGQFLVNVSLAYYSLRIGTVQFFLGIFILLFGITAVAIAAGMTKYTFGIWAGVASTAAGVLGVLLAQMRRRDLLLACLFVSIAAIILTLVAIVAACIGIKEDVDKWNSQEQRKNFLDSLVNYESLVAINSVLLILSVAEAMIALLNIVFCSLFIRMVLREKPDPAQEGEKTDTADGTEAQDGESPQSKTHKSGAPVTHRGCGCTVYLSYNGAVGVRCGILQLTLGILLLAFGIVNLALKGWGSAFAIAVWGSIFIIVAGALGVRSATDKRRDILISCCFFSTISCAAVTGLFITAAVGTHYDFPTLPAEKVVVHIILMIFALTEFITSIFQATFCGKAFPAHEAHQQHFGDGGPVSYGAKANPDGRAACGTAGFGTVSHTAPVPGGSTNPMVILPLPGRSKEPFNLQYGPSNTGGFFVSVNEKVPYIDEEDVTDTSVHYTGKETFRGQPAKV